MRTALLATALVAVLAQVGCNNPQFHQRQGIRDARMERYIGRARVHESNGWVRAGRTIDGFERAAHYRAEHLERTGKLINDSYARRVDDLTTKQPRRRAFIRDQFRGKPEQIDETFAKMAY